MVHQLVSVGCGLRAACFMTLLRSALTRSMKRKTEAFKRTSCSKRCHLRSNPGKAETCLKKWQNHAATIAGQQGYNLNHSEKTGAYIEGLWQ
jgi:hypothetical protein